MISMEAWTTIRYLKAQGLGTRTIAKEVGIARNTVKKALRSQGRLDIKESHVPIRSWSPSGKTCAECWSMTTSLAAASSRSCVKGLRRLPDGILPTCRPIRS